MTTYCNQPKHRFSNKYGTKFQRKLYNNGRIVFVKSFLYRTEENAVQKYSFLSPKRVKYNWFFSSNNPV